MEEEVQTRKGGRAARRAKRLNAPIIHHPPLMTNVPAYEVASAEGVEQIHETAMRIIEEIGVEFREAQAIETWKRRRLKSMAPGSVSVVTPYSPW